MPNPPRVGSRSLTEDGLEVMWEACQTLTGSWGYHRDNLEFRTRRSRQHPAAARHLVPLPQATDILTRTLPVTRPDVLVPIVELFLTES